MARPRASGRGRALARSERVGPRMAVAETIATRRNRPRSRHPEKRSASGLARGVPTAFVLMGLLVATPVLSTGAAASSVSAPFYHSRSVVSSFNTIAHCGSAKSSLPGVWGSNNGTVRATERASTFGCALRSPPPNATVRIAQFESMITVSIPIHIPTGNHHIQAWWNLSWLTRLSYVLGNCTAFAKYGWDCVQESYTTMEMAAEIYDSTNATASWVWPQNTAPLWSSAVGWTDSCASRSYCIGAYSFGHNGTYAGKFGWDASWNLSRANGSHRYVLATTLILFVVAEFICHHADFAGGSQRSILDLDSNGGGARLSSISVS